MQQGIDEQVEGKDCFIYGQVYSMAVQITSAACMKNFGVTKDVLLFNIAPRLPRWQAKALKLAYLEITF
jgi:hypothetical protein